MSFKLLSQGLMNAAGNSEGRLETLLFVGGGKEGAGATDQRLRAVVALAEGPGSILSGMAALSHL